MEEKKKVIATAEGDRHGAAPTYWNLSVVRSKELPGPGAGAGTVCPRLPGVPHRLLNVSAALPSIPTTHRAATTCDRGEQDTYGQAQPSLA